MQHGFAGADKEGMPGTLHQGILAIFQEDPWLAFDVLGVRRPVEGTPTARRAEVERDGKTEYTHRPGYPDLVLVHSDPGKRRRRRRKRGIVIAVEAQKAYDRDKRWMIPVYQANLADQVAANIKAMNRIESRIVDLTADEIAEEIRAAGSGQ